MPARKTPTTKPEPDLAEMEAAGLIQQGADGLTSPQTLPVAAPSPSEAVPGISGPQTPEWVAQGVTPEGIHVLLGKVLHALPAVGKNQRNSGQGEGYAYQGIDDILAELNEQLGRHGVFFVPDVIERLESQRTTGGGKAMYAVHLHVRYRFFGPAGDCVEASGWGEGTDMGDKATPKAMTSAMKQVLRQVFAIAVSDHDPDASTPEDTYAAPPVKERVPAADVDRVTDVRERLAVLKVTDEALWRQVGKDWREQRIGSVNEQAWENPDPAIVVTDEELDAADLLVDAAEEAVLARAQERVANPVGSTGMTVDEAAEALSGSLTHESGGV